tara:strand:- start:3161 stop:4153 length:993 start_codon:yes stop_codon:yes gene_type:complete
MGKNILIFRTDRIGDLIVTCPAIITIKKYFENSNITLIASDKNFEYAKNLDIFDCVYKFPKNNIFNKIIFIYKLTKKTYDYIFVFDGKDRSILTSALIKSGLKVALKSKNKLYYKNIKIKFFDDSEKTNLNDVFQKMLDYSEVNEKINNYQFLVNKKDNNFSSKINIKNYIHIHLDEKWLNKMYIKTYTNIYPAFDDFISFLNKISEKNQVLITTGIHDFDLLKNLRNNYFNKIDDKIFYKNNKNNSIFLIFKPSFDDLESLLRKTKTLISCHGALTHAANSFNIKNVDILEESRVGFYKKFTSYLKNYNPIYRSEFTNLSNTLLKIIDE